MTKIEIKCACGAIFTAQTDPIAIYPSSQEYALHETAKKFIEAHCECCVENQKYSSAAVTTAL